MEGGEESPWTWAQPWCSSGSDAACLNRSSSLKENLKVEEERSEMSYSSRVLCLCGSQSRLICHRPGGVNFTLSFLVPSTGVMPKHGLDVAACEVFRFYKLVTLKGLIEPISMIVPRRVSGNTSAPFSHFELYLQLLYLSNSWKVKKKCSWNVSNVALHLLATVCHEVCITTELERDQIMCLLISPEFNDIILNNCFKLRTMGKMYLWWRESL